MIVNLKNVVSIFLFSFIPSQYIYKFIVSETFQLFERYIYIYIYVYIYIRVYIYCNNES